MQHRRNISPLDQDRLSRLALRYVERFATTRGRLTDYLGRKIRERGWAGDADPDVAVVVETMVRLGYIDEAAWTEAKIGSLQARGFGDRRVAMELRRAGITPADHPSAPEDERARALRLARRKRLGPFSATPDDPRIRQRTVRALIAAGHAPSVAFFIADARPGDDVACELE